MDEMVLRKLEVCGFSNVPEVALYIIVTKSQRLYLFGELRMSIQYNGYPLLYSIKPALI